MNIDAGREESGVNESGKFLRSGFGSSKVVRHIEENMLLLFRDVIVVDFVANIRGTDENTRVILLERGMAADGELVGNAVSVKCFHRSFPERETAEFAEVFGIAFVIVIATALHEIAVALMTEFIGGDEISIRVTGPFACAILFFTNIACIIVRGSRFSGGSEMNSIRIVHVGKSGNRRERSGFTYALKWEKIPSKVTNRALRSGKSGCRGNKRGSHL